MRKEFFSFPVILAITLTVFGLPAGNAFSQGAGAVLIDLTARNTAFDQKTITVPAGAPVIIHFNNRDRIPHNVSVYESEKASRVIYYGRIINGSQSVRYEFAAPAQPGIYFFRCDLHPREMTGDFVVR